MKLASLFERDINRHIDPAVVVSKLQDEVVTAEIEEYVFTRDIVSNLYKVLDAFLNYKDQKTGIWISGYYGSGKSHFIKYLHYLINPATSEKAFERFISEVKLISEAGDAFSLVNVANLKKRVAGVQIEDDLFNIEDITDQQSGEKLTRILLRRLCRLWGLNESHIPLALVLEKHLKKKGLLEEFIRILEEEHAYTWRGSEMDVTMMACRTVVDTALRLDPALDGESIYSILSNPEQYTITIENTLIPQFREFLAEKGPDYRLLFLIDEVSQYMGQNTDLILNLQNVVERISDLGNKVWIACTAQQKLDELLRGALKKSQNDKELFDKFGKILGRFDTKISLESADPAYITQKRVLDKSADAQKMLRTFYSKEREALNAVYRMPQANYRAFDSEEAFVQAYPFVPYQFKLISEVFASFRMKDFVIEQVKDNERSVIGITHYTAKEHAGQELGHLVPFDAFFNGMMRENLTHYATTVLQNPLQLDFVKGNPFAQRVVYTLFMLSNLSSSVQQNFPPVVDNIAMLLVQRAEDSMRKLQQQVKEVLDRLIDNNVAYRDAGNRYFFFTEDEMEVQAQIRNTTTNLEDKLSFFEEAIRELTNFRSKMKFHDNSIGLSLMVDDKRVSSQGEIEVLFSVTDERSPEQWQLNNNVRSLVLLLNEQLADKGDFFRMVQLSVQTEKFFRHFVVNGSETRKATRNKMMAQQTQRRGEILSSIKAALMQCRFLSGTQLHDAGEVSGASPEGRYQNLLTFHAGNLFRDYQLCRSYATDFTSLKQKYQNHQTDESPLTGAEKELDQVLSNKGGQLSLEELIRHFKAVPYGWPDAAVADMALQLAVKGKRELGGRGDRRLLPAAWAEKAASRSEHAALMVRKKATIEASLLKEAADAFFEAFTIRLQNVTDAGRLTDEIDSRLDALVTTYKPLREQYFDREKHEWARAFYQLIDKLSEIRQATRTERKLELLTDGRSRLRDMFDEAKENKDLAQNKLGIWQELCGFYRDKQQYERELGDGFRAEFEILRQLKTDPQPGRLIRKAMEAKRKIEAEVKAKNEALRNTLQDEIQSAVDELKAVADKSTDDGGSGFIATQTEQDLYQSLENCRSSQDLKMLGYRIPELKTKALREIAKKQVQPEQGEGNEPLPEPEQLRLPGMRIIRTEAEAEAYLSELRTEMMKHLRQNKQLITPG